jgi:hypothetical protein
MKMKTYCNFKYFIAVIAILTLLNGCDSAKKDWQKAQSINTIEGFREFVKLHPKSDFTLFAADSIDWILTQKSDSVERYQTYLAKFPNSNHVQIATQFIDRNLPTDYKNAIELMFIYWSNIIKPVKREGMFYLGGESTMVSTTGNANGKIRLDSLRYAQTLINKLAKYSGIKCSIEFKDAEHNYEGTKTFITEKSKFVCSIEGSLNLKIALKSGEFGLLENKQFYVKYNTTITIENKEYSFSYGRWLKK